MPLLLLILLISCDNNDCELVVSGRVDNTQNRHSDTYIVADQAEADSLCNDFKTSGQLLDVECVFDCE